MHRHEMTRPRHFRRQVHPAGLESEGLELARVDGADAANAREILGCARYVDGLAEQRDGGLATRVDRRGDPALARDSSPPNAGRSSAGHSSRTASDAPTVRMVVEIRGKIRATLACLPRTFARPQRASSAASDTPMRRRPAVL